MTYEEAREMIREHLDYGGSLDSHGLAVAMSAAPAPSAADAAGARITYEQMEQQLSDDGYSKQADVIRQIIAKEKQRG